MAELDNVGKYVHLFKMYVCLVPFVMFMYLV